MAITYYEYDINGHLIEELDENGNVLVEYTHLLDGTLISERRNGVDRFYHSDGDGNTTCLTDENGDLTDTFAYNSSGEVTERTGTTPTPFQFQGQQGLYFDSETGDYLSNDRPLSPGEGRWLSADPFGLDDGSNLYLFAKNNSGNLLGLTGLASKGRTPFEFSPSQDALQSLLNIEPPSPSNPAAGQCGDAFVLAPAPAKPVCQIISAPKAVDRNSKGEPTGACLQIYKNSTPPVVLYYKVDTINVNGTATFPVMCYGCTDNSCNSKNKKKICGLKKVLRKPADYIHECVCADK